MDTCIQPHFTGNWTSNYNRILLVCGMWTPGYNQILPGYNRILLVLTPGCNRILLVSEHLAQTDFIGRWPPGCNRILLVGGHIAVTGFYW
jgi:hypothetical protein